MWPLGRQPRDRQCFEYRTWRRFVSLRIQVLCWSLTRNLLFGTKKARFAHALFIALRPRHGGCPSSNWRGYPRNASIAVGLELTYKSNKIIEGKKLQVKSKTRNNRKYTIKYKISSIIEVIKRFTLLNERNNRKAVLYSHQLLDNTQIRYEIDCFYFQRENYSAFLPMLFISFWDELCYVKFKPKYL